MIKNRKKQKIKKFWNEQAKKYKTSPKASWADLLVEKETKLVKKYVKKKGKILDAGCANGYTTIEIVTENNNVYGIDYATEMIKQANILKKTLSYELRKNINFLIGDLTTIDRFFEKNYFDEILVKRVIISFGSRELQEKALKKLKKVLKNNGRLLLFEPTIQGLKIINKLRKIFRVEPLRPPWFNKYIDEKRLYKFIKNDFKIEKIINFSSTYYIGSRVIYAAICKLLNKTPEYNSLFNKIFLNLPSIGNYGVQKLFILRKK